MLPSAAQKNSISVLIIALLFLGVWAESWASDPLIMGVFPRRNAIETNKMFLPMAKYLTRVLHQKVILETSKDFASFWEGVINKRYDIVHYNQYHYVKSHLEFGYSVILKNVEFGNSTIAGSLVVRKDSGINTIAELRGKKIVFGGGPKAMQSYIVATYLLRKAGLRKGDYVEEFAKNPPNAIMATYYGQAQASGTGHTVLRLSTVSNKINTNKLAFLAMGEQLPQLPWAVINSMSKKLRDEIQKTLSELEKSKQGLQILKKAGLSRLEITKDSEYDAHRKIILEVLQEKY